MAVRDRPRKQDSKGASNANKNIHQHTRRRCGTCGVFDSDELIGYVWAYEHTFREEIRIYVNEIHVDEAYRNRGIGKQLLSAVENLARGRGYKALYIHAEGDNDGAIRLYQNEGYEIERVQLRKAL